MLHARTKMQPAFPGNHCVTLAVLAALIALPPSGAAEAHIAFPNASEGDFQLKHPQACLCVAGFKVLALPAN